MENKKICENCRFYLQHYVKSLQKYQSVSCGHCKKIKSNKKMIGSCKYWECGDIAEEEAKESIKKTLLRMSNQINDIALILQDDIAK